MHCDWTIKCAEAGKHILCEKPLATTTDECRKMIDAAKANNVILVEAFTHRWNHHLKTAKKIIKDGDLGSVVTTDSSLCFTTNPENNIRFNPSLSGGALWDAGCYAVYATRFVLSEEPIYANGESFDVNNYGVDTTFKGILEFESGVLSSVTTSMNQPFRCHMNIDLTNGRIEIPNMFDDSGPIIIKKGVSAWKPKTLAKKIYDTMPVQAKKIRSYTLKEAQKQWNSLHGIKSSTGRPLIWDESGVQDGIAVYFCDASGHTARAHGQMVEKFGTMKIVLEIKCLRHLRT